MALDGRPKATKAELALVANPNRPKVAQQVLQRVAADVVKEQLVVAVAKRELRLGVPKKCVAAKIGVMADKLFS